MAPMAITDWTEGADVEVNAREYEPLVASTETRLWDSTKVKPGSFAQTEAADSQKNSCPQVKSILAVVNPTGQAVTLRLQWMVGGVWKTMNGSGSGESVTAGTTYAKQLPCGGQGTKITVTSGGTIPSAFAASLRLRKEFYALPAFP